jgi:ribonuclease BN (tRNA processing enzyme)
VVELWDGPVDLGPVRVTPIPVVHTDSSVAYRVESRGKIFCYSGDADVCPGLVEAARDADLFLCECSFPDEKKVEGHLTPTSAGEMAAQARAKRLVLTHFYPIMETIDPIAPCARAYRGEVELGQDLMRTAV